MRYPGGAREKACHIRLRQQIAALSATFIVHTSRLFFFFKKLETTGVMRGYDDLLYSQAQHRRMSEQDVFASASSRLIQLSVQASVSAHVS